ncbi:hypothetical protein CFC21_026072 [Triticum aestivum]|uniref:Uncharacterized protein n=2 Tax=Triticum aestivum TaxID=4565 RepID=A0A3B6CHG7_WHEAT|nr:hypothetical protein CFC21_026072 [Triticum aestivum]
MKIMQFAFRRIRSLLSSDAKCLKPCLSRHSSTFENFDTYPVSNAIWHSREVDMKDLGDPVNFFGRNRMFDSILYNKLVGRPKSKDGRKINPYLAKIIKMNPKMVSEIFAYALRSLAVITVENHRRGVPLGAAVELSNLRISYSCGDDGTQAAAAKYPKGGQPSNGTGQQGQAPPATGQQGQPPAATGQQGQPPAATGQQGQAPAATGQQGQPPAATGQQGQPPAATGQQGQAPPATGQQGQAPQPAARGGQSQTFTSSNAPPQGQPSQAQGNSIPQGQAFQTQDPHALLQ